MIDKLAHEQLVFWPHATFLFSLVTYIPKQYFLISIGVYIITLSPFIFQNLLKVFLSANYQRSWFRSI